MTGTTPQELTVTVLRGLDDSQVAHFLADDRELDAWVRSSLTGLPALAHPDLVTGLSGTVGIELSRPGVPDASYLMRFDRGSVEILDAGAPDVTIRTEALLFARMLTGERRAALLYLADRLSLKGDELLALAVDGLLVSAASGGTHVDPRLLDPVEVSRAILDVSTERLDEVMGGGLREVILGEVFRRLPDFVDERKARRADVAVVFRVSGAADGGADRYLVQIRQGRCVVTREPAADVSRDATLLLDGPGFLRLVLGHVNPVRAVMTGRLKVKGDPAKALALNTVMRIPKP